jgi:hypothetical protein
VTSLYAFFTRILLALVLVQSVGILNQIFPDVSLVTTPRYCTNCKRSFIFYSIDIVCTYIKGFAASGALRFQEHEDTPVEYDYNIQTNNKNDRTLLGFSVEASNKMRPCPRCDFYTDFFRFFQFYGKADYAREWMLAAFAGTRTVFDSSTADFTTTPVEARAGTLHQNHHLTFPESHSHPVIAS